VHLPSLPILFALLQHTSDRVAGVEPVIQVNVTDQITPILCHKAEKPLQPVSVENIPNVLQPARITQTIQGNQH
jgi:hypothetical protein